MHCCRRPRKRSPCSERLLGMTRAYTASWRPHEESAAYAHRRRHPLTHLYAKRSQQLGCWAGRRVVWSRLRSHFPHMQGPRVVRRPEGCRTDSAEARAGQYRPTAAYLHKRERKRRVKAPVKPAAVCQRQHS